MIEPPCTILDNPILVRLFIDDVHFLQKNNIDINSFIRGTVRVRIEEIKKASLKKRLNDLIIV